MKFNKIYILKKETPFFNSYIKYIVLLNNRFSGFYTQYTLKKFINSSSTSFKNYYILLSSIQYKLYISIF